MSQDSLGSEGSSHGSLDSCGPSPPPETRALEARIAGQMRLFTRAGCPTLESVSGKRVEVWTGRRWATVRVREVPLRPEESVLRVSLDTGSCLECSAEHPWALVVQKIRPVRSGDAATNHLSAPHYPLDPADLSGETDQKAYVLGCRFGRKITERRGSKLTIPESIFRLCPMSLGLFVAGWFDTQNGSFFGPPAVIHDLKLLLCRLGVCSTSVGDLMGTFRTLAVSAEDGRRIPNPTGKMRTSFRDLRCGQLPRIVGVETVAAKPIKLFTITSDTTKTVVVDGVLTIC